MAALLEKLGANPSHIIHSNAYIVNRSGRALLRNIYIPSSLSVEEADVYVLLSSPLAPKNAAQSVALARYAREQFRINEYWVAERIVWWALSTAVTGDEETAEPPLVAARHLLGLYVYPVDPEEPFGLANRSLRARFTNKNVGRSETRKFNIGDRQRIAATEAGYSSRSKLSGKQYELPKVAAAVWLAMKVEFTKLTPDQLQDLRQNALSDGRPDWHRANGDPEGWEIARDSSVDEGPSGAASPVDQGLDLQQESRDEDAGVAEPEGADASPRDSEGEAVAVVDPDPKATPRRIKPRALVVGGVILVAVALVVASLVVKTLSSESESTTLVETFVPSEADVEAAADLGDDGLHAECAARSYSSARTDARMCLAANFLRDPCFLTASDRAVCPDVEGLGPDSSGRALAVLLSATVDPDWLGPGDLVGAEQAASTDYPWAFQLDYRDKDGQPYVCQVDVRKLVSFKAASFSCSTTGSHTRVMLDKEAFIAGKHMISIQPDDVVIATDFQRTSPQWSVAVQLPGSNKLERIDITEAWF